MILALVHMCPSSISADLNICIRHGFGDPTRHIWVRVETMAWDVDPSTNDIYIYIYTHNIYIYIYT